VDNHVEIENMEVKPVIFGQENFDHVFEDEEFIKECIDMGVPHGPVCLLKRMYLEGGNEGSLIIRDLARNMFGCFDGEKYKRLSLKAIEQKLFDQLRIPYDTYRLKLCKLKKKYAKITPEQFRERNNPVVREYELLLQDILDIQHATNMMQTNVRLKGRMFNAFKHAVLEKQRERDMMKRMRNK